jgi:hypothetical protein
MTRGVKSNLVTLSIVKWYQKGQSEDVNRKRQTIK